MNRTAVTVALAVAVLARAAAPAAAQDAKHSAELLFEQGQALLKDGKTADACPKFEESEKLDPAIGTLLNLAHCYELAGRVMSAWNTYLDAEEMAKTRQDKRQKGAHDRAAQLSSQVPKLVVTASSPPTGLAITIAGQLLATPMIGAPVPEDPGPITVAATAPGYQPFNEQVALETGKTTTVDVKLTKVPDVVAHPPPPLPPHHDVPPPVVVKHAPVRSGHSRRVLGLSIGGGGAVVAIGGGVLVLLARSAYHGAFTGDPPPCDSATGGCTPAGYQTTSDARSNANLGGAIAGVGVAAIAVGALLYLTAPHDAPRDRVTYVVPTVGGGAIGVALGGAL